MMKLFGNRKGFVVEGVVIVAVGVTLLLAALWKPLSSTVGSFIGSAQPQKVSKTYYKKAESAPMFYQDKDGKLIPAPQPYKMTVESSQALSEESQLTLWQKIKNLGVIGIIMAVACFAYPPLGVVVMFIIKKITGGAKKVIDNANGQIKEIESKKTALEGQAEQIVVSVDAGLKTLDESIKLAKNRIDVATDATLKTQYSTVAQALEIAKKDFLTAMAKEQDSDTEDLVKEMLKND